MLSVHLDAIRKALKVPFIDAKYQQKHFTKIAETEYRNPENEDEVVTLTICIPNITFDDNVLAQKYG